MDQTSSCPVEQCHDFSVDLVRTVAIIAVIFLHATADLTVPSMDQFEIIRWTANDVYQSIGRICIPLFVMLSGALLLQPEKHDTLGSFFRKRWKRIGLPWIFWGAAYFAWDFLVLNQPFTTNAVAQGILTGPYYNFWYLYMLLGLYLLTPVLRIMLPKVSHVALKRYLLLWFVCAGVVPFIVVFAFSGFSAVVANVSWVIYLLFGLTGYFVLGTLLVKMKIRRLFLSILAAIGLAFSVISIFIIQSPIGGNREIFAFTVYFGPWTILTSAAIFLLLYTVKKPTQTLATQNSGFSAGRKLIHVISENTLPLALFHLMVLESLQRGYFGLAINGNTINTIIGVPLITVITLFVSLGIILLLKKIPHLSRFIG
jgi:surface polysaccharide O-acyltransferase-like enzyme